MGLRLSELAQGMRSRLDVEIGPGLAVTIEYRSGLVTPRYIAELGDATIGQVFEQLGLSWNLVDEDGHVIPATEEGLLLVPSEVTNRVFRAVLSGRVPNL